MHRLVPALALPCLLLACLAAPSHAQQISIPGRQVVEGNGFLLEVVYTSSQVRLRLFDYDGQPVDMSELWVRRCSVDVIAQRGDYTSTRSAKVRLIRPENGLPYLLAKHQLGPLHEQDALEVAIKLKNVARRGDVNDRWRLVWQRHDHGHGCSATRPACRRTRDRDCSLCRHDLCLRPVPLDGPHWR